jgi:ABC-2 type transport system ATP-binding protein
MTLISVSDLSKTFTSVRRREGIAGSLKDLFHRDKFEVKAVEGISFEVAEGELIGFIGPNGAGKSTTIKMLTGILKPSTGSISVMGYSPFADRKEYTAHIGVVFGQRTQLWWDIAVIESLKLLADIYNVQDFQKQLDKLVEILEIGDLLSIPVRKLSLGQRVRCDIAASLIYNPKILFLDEPTIGLDAVAKDSLRRFLRSLNTELKTTIIMTTHDLKEIEELCKRIIIIDKGKLIFNGQIEKIKALPGLKRKLLVDFSQDVDLLDLNNMFNQQAEFISLGKRRFQGLFVPQVISVPEVMKKILDKFEVYDFTVEEPEIEEVILKIYREGLSF